DLVHGPSSASTRDQARAAMETMVLAPMRLARLGRPQMRGQARVIATALTARAPGARYLVGPDARLFPLAERAALTVVSDRVKRLVLGLEPTPSLAMRIHVAETLGPPSAWFT